MAKKIFISAGELSGDEHAAQVVMQLRALLPECSLSGMGGQNMRKAGVETVVDSEVSGSIMGFLQVAKSIGTILKAINQLKELISTWKPDLIILVDYPDFHFRIAKFASKLGIPVLFYIPPSVWAWRPGRVKLIEKYVHKVAAIYPFEPEFYRSKGYNQVVYVGHPFADEFKNHSKAQSDRTEFFKRLNLDPTRPTIAILPGSRRTELQRLLKPALEGLKLLREQMPDVQAILPIAPSLNMEMLQSDFAEIFNSQICATRESSLEVLKFCDAGLLKSGTSNLQAAFLQLPFSMFYQADPISALIAKALIPIQSFSLVNIIRPNTVKEVIQDEVTPEILATEMQSLLEDQEKRAHILVGLSEVRDKLSNYEKEPLFSDSSSTSERVALIARDMIT